MDFLKAYIREIKTALIFVTSLFCLMIITFFLYDLPLEAVAYPIVLGILLGMGFLAFDYRRKLSRHRELLRMREFTAFLISDFPKAGTQAEKDLQQIILNICLQQRKFAEEMKQNHRETKNYYTMWVHQIKTPISAMGLQLQNEDTEFSRKLSLELLRIEQYVDMVMAYARMDADTTDYVIMESDLDSIIRRSVRKFSDEFISRRISLDYQPTGLRVLTDEKWLAFVIEQVISNALKYTKEGSITIRGTNFGQLMISDTGAGISPEDLPRIFEMGYTGYNGRMNKKASGIGLYLCRKICGNLGHGIQIESKIGYGTTVTLDLSRRKVFIE